MESLRRSQDKTWCWLRRIFYPKYFFERFVGRAPSMIPVTIAVALILCILRLLLAPLLISGFDPRNIYVTMFEPRWVSYFVHIIGTSFLIPVLTILFFTFGAIFLGLIIFLHSLIYDPEASQILYLRARQAGTLVGCFVGVFFWLQFVCFEAELLLGFCSELAAFVLNKTPIWSFQFVGLIGQGVLVVVSYLVLPRLVIWFKDVIQQISEFLIDLGILLVRAGRSYVRSLLLLVFLLGASIVAIFDLWFDGSAGVYLFPALEPKNLVMLGGSLVLVLLCPVLFLLALSAYRNFLITRQLSSEIDQTELPGAWDVIWGLIKFKRYPSSDARITAIETISFLPVGSDAPPIVQENFDCWVNETNEGTERSEKIDRKELIERVSAGRLNFDLFYLFVRMAQIAILWLLILGLLVFCWDLGYYFAFPQITGGVRSNEVFCALSIAPLHDMMSRMSVFVSTNLFRLFPILMILLEILLLRLLLLFWENTQQTTMPLSFQAYCDKAYPIIRWSIRFLLILLAGGFVLVNAYLFCDLLPLYRIGGPAWRLSILIVDGTTVMAILLFLLAGIISILIFLPSAFMLFYARGRTWLFNKELTAYRWILAMYWLFEMILGPLLLLLLFFPGMIFVMSIIGYFAKSEMFLITQIFHTDAVYATFWGMLLYFEMGLLLIVFASFVVSIDLIISTYLIHEIERKVQKDVTKLYTKITRMLFYQLPLVLLVIGLVLLCWKSFYLLHFLY